MIYGNNSVLERMHLAKTLEILERDEETNFILKLLNAEELKKARRIIRDCIMGTDMVLMRIFSLDIMIFIKG